MSRDTFDVVVIGSGFGGAIAALRASEAGRKVLVLERGRRWAPGQFPRDVTDTDTLLWRHDDDPAARGLFDLRFLSGIATLTAAGVGGGSLVYASIHYRPRASIFADARWPRAFTLDSLEPYYRKVETSLGVSVVPPEPPLAKRRAFHDANAALGRRVMDTPQAVSWTSVFGGEANAVEGRSPCRGCAECEFGCNYGAKNTLDFMHLREAEAAGATLRTGCLVSHVSPGERGGWVVHYRDLDGGEARQVLGHKVVVAAGTLGSNEILLRSRDVHKTLPKLPARLGHGYSGNGDFLGNIQDAAQRLEPWVGPDVTSVAWHDDDEAHSFVLATPTFNEPVMRVLASLGQPPPRPLLDRLARPLWPKVPQLLVKVLRSGLLSKPMKLRLRGAGPADRMTTVFAIGRDDAGGRLILRKGKLDVAWDYARENRALIERQRAAMQQLASAYGGTYADFPLWGPFGRTLTVHNLGGCALSNSVDQGVVGIDGQVHGHAGLYVCDGAVIPTAIGSHPVMTIAAVAEWIAERMLAEPA